MKFNKLIATFRNGMVGPRLRGRQDTKEASFSAETFENFKVDKIGGSEKRIGTRAIETLEIDRDDVTDRVASIYLGNRGGFTRGQANALRTAQQVEDDSLGLNTYIFELANTEYLFKNASTILNLNTGEYVMTCEFGGPQASEIDEDLGLNFFSGVYDSSGDYTGRPEFGGPMTYANRAGSILQGRKVGGNTVCLTTSINGPMYYHRRMFKVKDTTELKEGFLILPWYVSLRIVLSNIGRSYTGHAGSQAGFISPISPYCAPYNTPNLNKSLKVRVIGYSDTIPAGVTGAGAVAVGDYGKAVQRNWYGCMYLSVPAEVLASFAFFDIYTSRFKANFFIKITSADSKADIVYFVYYVLGTGEGNYYCYAQQITAGYIISDTANPHEGTYKWAISSWGGVNGIPKVVDYNNGRMWLAQNDTQTSTYWVSGSFPNQPNDIQIFSSSPLLQDSTSDKSGFGINDITSTNPDAFGMHDNSPNMAKINAISARRRIHILTERGECQVEPRNGVFLPSTFNQINVRSNSALAYDIALGDGKIFYISEEGIRYISTEDADYESVDGLVTTSLTGLDIKYRKIVWSEVDSCLYAITTKNEVFAIALHGDTSISAVSKMDFNSNKKTYCEGEAYDAAVALGTIRSKPFSPSYGIRFERKALDVVCGLLTSYFREAIKVVHRNSPLPSVDDPDKYYVNEWDNDYYIGWYSVMYAMGPMKTVSPEFEEKYTQLELDDRYKPIYYPSPPWDLTTDKFLRLSNNGYGYSEADIRYTDGYFVESSFYAMVARLYSMLIHKPMEDVIVLYEGTEFVYNYPMSASKSTFGVYYIMKESGGAIGPLHEILTERYPDVSDTKKVTLAYKPYVATIISQPIYDGDGGINLSPVGDIHRIDRVAIQVDNSGEFKVGSEEGKLVPSEGFNGRKDVTKTITVDFPNSPDVEAKVIIVSDTDSPLNISGVALRGTSYSGDS